MADQHQDDTLIEAILASGVKIPPMPGVMVEFMALERNPDAALSQYAVILRRDTALTGALFRVAGSPVFGARRVDNLERALAILGLKNASAIVRSESMRHALSDPRYMAFMSMLWERLERIAALTIIVAKALRAPDLSQDAAYLLGMFHDCGLALLCKRSEDYARAFSDLEKWPDILALDQRHQTYHAVVGMMLARTWQLPPNLVQAIRHHHEPEALARLPDAVGKPILALQFAIHLHNSRHAQSDTEWEEHWREPMLARFQLGPEALAALETNLLASAE